MRNRFWDEKHGQILLWVALAMPILILFAALAVDMGVIYMTRAKLANAADAAVLTGVKTLPSWSAKEGSQSAGQADAQRYASEMFVGNFGSGSATQVYTWCPGDPSCPPNTTSLKLRATTTVNNTFINYFPQSAQWTLGATSQATRGNLVMSLILDRSHSMTTNGGKEALQSAVPAFIQDFSDGVDHVAMISFASDATVNVAMTQTFITPVKTAVNNLSFGGGTFGTGAGTYGNNFDTSHGPPLSMADNQNNGVIFPPGTSVEKVAVYFTDGLMNTIQEKFNCTNLGPTLYNFGGYDPTTTHYDFFNPLSNDYNTNDYSSNFSGTSAGGGCSSDDWGTCNSNPPLSATKRCQGITQFPSQKHNRQEDFSRANITEEAQYRGIYTANTMRGESPIPTYVFVIGLGSEMSDQCTDAFLATVANDPNGNKYSCPAAPAVYNAALPPGLFLPVTNCPSTTCTQSLNQAFQTIAARILLRLSQ